MEEDPVVVVVTVVGAVTTTVDVVVVVTMLPMASPFGLKVTINVSVLGSYPVAEI